MKNALILAIASISALGVVTLGAVPERTMAQPASRIGSALVWHLREVDTSVVPVDNPPKGQSAGDHLVFVARVSSGGKRIGRYVGNCAFVTKTEIFCSIDFNVYGQGRIELAGELSTTHPDAVFPVTGGSGRFARARGYLTNHQTSTGTYANDTLYLYAG